MQSTSRSSLLFVLALVTSNAVKLSAMVGALLALVACGPTHSPLTPEQVATLASYQKTDTIELPGAPLMRCDLYEMTYGADYAFDEYMVHGGGGTTFELSRFINTYLMHQADAPSGSALVHGCASFTARDEQGHVLFGRNFDGGYGHSKDALVFRTAPADGYASISVAYVPYVWQFGSPLAAPYVTMDGMNEAGVAISTLDTDSVDQRYDPQKPSLWFVTALRLVLDHAANVNEALALLQRFNLSWDVWGYHSINHMMIADRSGDSVVVEYHQGEMRVLRSGRPWQVATNYDLYGKDPADLSHCWRYATAWSTLEAKNGVVTSAEAMSLILSIAQDTYWSAIYDLEAGTVQLTFMKNPSRQHVYTVRAP
jgi:hypothetical protein